MAQEPTSIDRRHVGRTPTLPSADHGDAVRQHDIPQRIGWSPGERYAVQGSTPLQITPHVGELHRLSAERNVVLLNHDRAHTERPPADLGSGTGPDRPKPRNAQV